MKNNSYDKKMFRLLAMVRKLEGGKIASTREFAEEFNVHHRTVQSLKTVPSYKGTPYNMTTRF